MAKRTTPKPKPPMPAKGDKIPMPSNPDSAMGWPCGYWDQQPNRGSVYRQFHVGPPALVKVTEITDEYVRVQNLGTPMLQVKLPIGVFE